MKKYLEKDQLLYFWTLLKDKLNKKVDKVENKQLSTNDYTTAEKNKLGGIEEGAEVNKVTSVNGEVGDIVIAAPENVVKYTPQTLTSDQKQQARTNIGAGISNFDGDYDNLTNKPTKLGQFLNDLDFQTLSEVTTSINTAIEGLGTVFDLKGSKATVADLPKTNNSIGDVWFVESESVGYIWLKPSSSSIERWEKFGELIDLSGYWNKTELVEMTNADIDSIMAT